jgi:hypothetical protein
MKLEWAREREECTVWCIKDERSGLAWLRTSIWKRKRGGRGFEKERCPLCREKDDVYIYIYIYICIYIYTHTHTHTHTNTHTKHNTKVFEKKEVEGRVLSRKYLIIIFLQTNNEL